MKSLDLILLTSFVDWWGTLSWWGRTSPSLPPRTPPRQHNLSSPQACPRTPPWESGDSPLAVVRHHYKSTNKSRTWESTQQWQHLPAQGTGCWPGCWWWRTGGRWQSRFWSWARGSRMARHRAALLSGHLDTPGAGHGPTLLLVTTSASHRWVSTVSDSWRGTWPQLSLSTSSYCECDTPGWASHDTSRNNWWWRLRHAATFILVHGGALLARNILIRKVRTAF